MSRGKQTETATLDAGPPRAGPDARWAELCGPEGADDEESADDHPGYGSLLGLGVRKQAKKPVIVLDPEVAEQAAQVMEINAGQLVVRGGQPAQGFGSLGFGALGGHDEPFEALGSAEGPEVGYEEDDELDPAVAEWAARVPGRDDEEDVGDVAEAAWTDEDPAEPEEVYESPVEAAGARDEEPASEEPMIEEPAFEAPVHEEAVVEQAWLEWARALLEPAPPTEGEAPPAHQADGFGEPVEPEAALTHMVEDIEPVEPELPKHELRQMLAQLPHSHPSRHLWRRLLSFLKRLFV